MLAPHRLAFTNVTLSRKYQEHLKPSFSWSSPLVKLLESGATQPHLNPWPKTDYSSCKPACCTPLFNPLIVVWYPKGTPKLLKDCKLTDMCWHLHSHSHLHLAQGTKKKAPDPRAQNKSEHHCDAGKKFNHNSWCGGEWIQNLLHQDAKKTHGSHSWSKLNTLAFLYSLVRFYYN